MDRDEEYVRRRRWRRDEKRAIVEEAATCGNVIGTAKRHRIQAQQIYRKRRSQATAAIGVGVAYAQGSSSSMRLLG